MLEVILLLSSFVALVLVIWFRTEAFVEYCRVFHLRRIYEEYDTEKKNDVSLNYRSFLRQHHNGFLSRLLNCPVCVSVWTTLFLSIFVGYFLMIPAICIGGLILFGIVDRLLG